MSFPPDDRDVLHSQFEYARAVEIQQGIPHGQVLGYDGKHHDHERTGNHYYYRCAAIVQRHYKHIGYDVQLIDIKQRFYRIDKQLWGYYFIEPGQHRHDELCSYDDAINNGYCCNFRAYRYGDYFWACHIRA